MKRRVTSPTWGSPPPRKQALKVTCGLNLYSWTCSLKGYKTRQLFCIQLHPLLSLAIKIIKIIKNPDTSKLKRSISLESGRFGIKQG